MKIRLVWGGAQAPLALPALLGRALLVVDEHGHAGRVPQQDLGLVEPVPAPQLGALGQRGAVGVALRVVAAHDDAAHALGGHRLGELGHADHAGHVLAAGHGHRAVVEDLVGDVDARGHRGPHRQAGRVEERPVADVLEDVGPVGERRPADPGGALAAHLVHDLGPVVDPQRHGVAAHPGAHERSLRRGGGTVVGTAAATSTAGGPPRPLRPGRRPRPGRAGPSTATGSPPASPPSTPERSRSATTAAIRSAVSSPSAGTSRRPCSSVLPTTRGALARP